MHPSRAEDQDHTNHQEGVSMNDRQTDNNSPLSHLNGENNNSEQPRELNEKEKPRKDSIHKNQMRKKVHNDHSLTITEKRRKSDPDNPEFETTEFKPKVFAEFTFYFLLAEWVGPLGYFLFIRFLKNGYILARNLHIYGGLKEIVRTLLWLAKVYCIVTTYVLNTKDYESIAGSEDKNTYDSRSQFWLLIYTDICLSILYGAYYSSYTESQIKKFKTQVYDPGHDIVERLTELIKTERTNAFDKKVIVRRFPEIDINNFVFVFPQKYEEVIPEHLDPKPLTEGAKQFKKVFVTEGITIRGEDYARYIADKGGYRRQFRSKINALKLLSRVLIFIRVLLPVGQNIKAIFDSPNKIPDVGQFVLYVIQQIFYCYFISRFAQIYDVLFLGLLLYYRKLRLLRTLKETVDVRPKSTQTELLKIVPAVPQNVENWLNIRKIFAGMNQQAFVVIDINMSFALFYSIFFIAVYALYTVSLLADLLQYIGNFLSQNPILQTTIFFTLIIVIIVLVIHLLLGVLINFMFSSEKKEWICHSEIVRSLQVNQEIYQDWKISKEDEHFLEGDEYMERIDNIYSLIGEENFSENFDKFVDRLNTAISNVIDGLTNEEQYNPHTLLGLKTTPALVTTIFTFVSAVGLSTINDIVNKADIFS